MKMKKLTVIIILLFTVLAYPQAVKIIRVVDGDTVKAIVDGKTISVRIWGIDAPEKKQPGGVDASTFLLNLLAISDDYDRGAADTIAHLDVKGKSYNRITARVWVWIDRQMVDVGLTMLHAGHAWHNERYTGGKSKKAYSVAQNAAVSAGIGIWSPGMILAYGAPIPPWVWKKTKK